jgi:hypothetical protein
VAAQENPDLESLRLELQEALVTFRHWNTQADQAAGVLITGDALLVAYGFSQRLAGVLFLASAIPIIFLFIYLHVLSVITPIVNLAIRLERKLSIREDSLAATYARVHLRTQISGFATIEALPDDELPNLNQKLPWHRWLFKPVSLILYAASIVQIGLAIASLIAYNYRFM